MKPYLRLLTPVLALALPLCTWAQAEVEPNDNTGQANPITLGTAMSGEQGSGFGCTANNNSVDWFVLNLANDGSINITTNASNSSAGNSVMRVLTYNSGGSQLFFNDHATGANGVPSSVTSTNHCLGKGTYYFQLQRQTGDCFLYDFTVSYTAPVYGNDVEPNNTFPEALTNGVLAPNTVTEGRVNFAYNATNNDDRFFIQTPGDGVLTVNVSAETPNAAGTLRVLVYNGAGSQLGFFDHAVGASSVPLSSSTTYICLVIQNP